MKNSKRMMAWLLAVIMLMTSVDYVQAAEAVQDGPGTVLTEVSDGDGSVINVSQNEMPQVSENEISRVSENTVHMVSESDVLEYGVAAYISGDGNDVSGGEVLYSGEEAGITWSITSDGLLTIGGEYDAKSGEKVTRPWRDYKAEIKKAVVTAQKVESTRSWFDECTSLTEIDLSGLDTGNVTDMQYMFSDCSSLKSLDLSGWDTGSVTSMTCMFSDCSSLKSLDLSGWDTGNVTFMVSMFSDCSSLKSLDLSGWDTSNVTYMTEMFYNCSNLSSLDVSGWDTSSVKYMDAMFQGCSSLNGLDINGWDTSSVGRMDYVFSGCSGLSSLDLSGWDTSSVSFMFYMFSGCSSLSSLDISGWDTGSVTNMFNMFSGCSSLSSLDLSGWNTINVDRMDNMFSGCNSLSSLDVSGWDTGSVTNMHNMFSDCSSLSSLDVSGWDTGSVGLMYNMFSGCSSLSSLDVSGWDTSRVGLMYNMFSGCSSLSGLDVSGWNTINVDRMDNMFSGCSSLSGLDVSGWNTINVDRMDNMFKGCNSLSSLDISGWNTGSVTNMYNMFSDCSSLSSLDLSGWDTGSVKSMDFMFDGCSSLNSLDVSGWDTGSVTDMYYMFAGCNSLSSLDVSGWDTGSVTDMRYMFNVCSSLSSLDVSGWDIGSVTNTEHMFSGCISLSGLDVSSWDTGSVTNMQYMFSGCSSLSSLDVSSWDTGSVTNMYSMFSSCSSLSGLNISGWDTGSVTNYMFDGCKSLMELKCMPGLEKDIILPHTMQDKDGNEYTYLPKKLTEGIWLYVRSISSGEVNGIEWLLLENGTLIITGEYDGKAITEEKMPWLDYTYDIKTAIIKAKKVESTAYWFDRCANLEKVVLSDFDASEVADMSGMFRNCTKLKELDLSRMNVSSLAETADMLSGCTGLEYVRTAPNLSVSIAFPVTMFDKKATPYAENPLNLSKSVSVFKKEKSGVMQGLGWFVEYRTLVIGGTDTSTTVSTIPLLPWCDYYQEIEKIKVYAKNVKSTAFWCNGLKSLTEADFSEFDTSTVENMRGMFLNCSGLETLDLSRFNMNKVTDADIMFDGCTKLKQIHTPLNVGIEVALPCGMMDSEQKVYLTLPVGLTKSVLLDGGQIVSIGKYYGMTWVILTDGTLLIFGTYSEAVNTDTSWLDYAAQIKSVKVTATGVKSTANWFDGLNKLEKVDFSSFDTSLVTDMSAMFRSCSSLKTLDLSGMNTGQVTNMRNLFSKCETLTDLNISTFDTSKVTDMAYMFYGCSSLESVDIAAWNTESLTDMTAMFTSCAKLSELDLSNFSTEKVTMSSHMFRGCSGLKELDLSNFDLAKLTTATRLLEGCTGVVTIHTPKNLALDVSLPFVMLGADRNLYTMLPKNNAESIVLDRSQILADGVYYGMNWAVLQDDTLLIVGAYGDALESDTSWKTYAANIKSAKVTATGVKSTKEWFAELSKLETVDFSGFDTSQVTDMSAMFRSCSSLKTLDLSGISTEKVTTMRNMFNNCKGLTDLNISTFNTSKVTDMAYMFYGCASLKKVDITAWNTENLKDMTAMFTNCAKLPELELDNFSTKNVVLGSHMFRGCKSLAELDLSNFDLSKLAAEARMLDGCTGIKTLHTPKNLALEVALPVTLVDGDGNLYENLPMNHEESLVLETAVAQGTYCGMTWVVLNSGRLVLTGAYGEAADTDTTWHEYAERIQSAKVTATGVTSTKDWFKGLRNLTTVDVSGLDTSLVTDMSGMFYGCSGLTTLDLSKITLANVAEGRDVFHGCSSLVQICAPTNLKVDVALPCGMLGTNGKVYVTLPKDLTTSVVLNAEQVVASGTYYGMVWGVLKDGTLLISGAYGAAADTDTTWHGYAGQIQSVKVTATGVTSTKDWFKGLSNLESVDVSAFDFSQVTDMSGMFSGCSKITKLDLSGWNVSKVVSADDMFDGCTGLAEVKVFRNLTAAIKLPHAMYDLQAVEYLQFPCNEQGEKVLYRFSCSGNHKGITWIIHEGTLLLNGDGSEAVGVKDWPWLKYADQIQKAVVYTKNVKSAAYWFDGCKNLTQIDWSGFDFVNVTDMSYMFRGCTALKALDVNVFTTAKITNLSGMLSGCTGLTTLDISGWDLSKVVECKGMLEGCIGMQEIRMPAKLAIDIEVPKTMYNYLGEAQTKSFPKYQSEAEWYYAVSPVKDGELHVSKVYPYTYTGKAIKPEIRVYDGATLLVEKKDYTISYKNNTKAAAHNAADAKGKSLAPAIIVKGKGNYTKTETVTFDILAKDISAEDVTVQELVAVAGKKVQNPVPKLTYNGKKLVKNKDFTVSYPDLEDKAKVDAYKAAGTYRVVVTGKGNFTGTREILFTITDGTLMSKVNVSKISTQQYDGGKAVEPNFKVTYKKTELVAGKDYMVTYKNNIEIGKASIILTGMGDYAGAKTVTFQIAGQSIAKASVSGIADKVYNGQAQTQQMNVELAGKKLEAGKDYTVSYSKNVNAGTASVTVTGKGAYSGSVKKTFKITPYDLESNSMQLFSGVPKDLVVAYEKGGSMPLVYLSFDGAQMTAKKDYIISYANNKALAGSADAKAPTITIKGKGNFKGTVSVKFTITAKDLQNTENPVSIRVPDMAYSAKNGKWLSKPVLTDSNGKKLVAGTDYEKTVTYTLEDGTALDKKSVVEAGQIVKVKVTGKGCYTGTMEATYKITQASFKSAKIKVEPQVYTGKGVTLDKEDITVTLDGKTLTYGVDYEIVEGSYKNNVKKGTASVTVKGLGNYGGEKTVKFKIVPKELIWFWRLFS